MGTAKTPMHKARPSPDEQIEDGDLSREATTEDFSVVQTEGTRP
jgi:hypothetical protein